MPAIVAILVEIMTMMPSLIKAGIDVTNLISTVSETIARAQAEGRDLTDAEIDAIIANRKRLMAELEEASKPQGG